MRKFPEGYVRQEHIFCKKEEDDFYLNTTEENREKVIIKRKEFKSGGHYKPPYLQHGVGRHFCPYI